MAEARRQKPIMIPKLTFEVIDRPDRMIRMINNFLLNRNKNRFNWSYIYAKNYPDLGVLIKKAKSEEEIAEISTAFFNKLYTDEKENLETIAKKFQKDWDKDGKKLLTALSKVVEKEWPKDCKEMKAWISLNPICPRFIDQRAFDVYWKFSPKK